jgi:hypothetical protein
MVVQTTLQEMIHHLQEQELQQSLPLEEDMVEDTVQDLQDSIQTKHTVETVDPEAEVEQHNLADQEMQDHILQPKELMVVQEHLQLRPKDRAVVEEHHNLDRTDRVPKVDQVVMDLQIVLQDHP